jgi:hypothetical protein
VATHQPLLLLCPLPLNLLQFPQQLGRLILIVILITTLLLFAVLLLILVGLILRLSLALPAVCGVVVVLVELADLGEDPAPLGGGLVGLGWLGFLLVLEEK